MKNISNISSEKLIICFLINLLSHYESVRSQTLFCVKVMLPSTYFWQWPIHRWKSQSQISLLQLLRLYLWRKPLSAINIRNDFYSFVGWIKARKKHRPHINLILQSKSKRKMMKFILLKNRSAPDKIVKKASETLCLDHLADIFIHIEVFKNFQVEMRTQITRSLEILHHSHSDFDSFVVCRIVSRTINPIRLGGSKSTHPASGGRGLIWPPLNLGDGVKNHPDDDWILIYHR